MAATLGNLMSETLFYADSFFKLNIPEYGMHIAGSSFWIYVLRGVVYEACVCRALSSSTGGLACDHNRDRSRHNPFAQIEELFVHSSESRELEWLGRIQEQNPPQQETASSSQKWKPNSAEYDRGVTK
jgi:hypothetical protein